MMHRMWRVLQRFCPVGTNVENVSLLSIFPLLHSRDGFVNFSINSDHKG